MVKKYRGLSPERKFELYVVRDGGCWGWNGPLDGNGYALLGYGGKDGIKSRYELAHRFSYRNSIGEISHKNHIHHKCNNKRCTNPEHLEQLTPSAHAKADFSAASNAKNRTNCLKCKSELVLNSSGSQRYCKQCHIRRRIEREARLKDTGTVERNRIVKLRSHCSRGHEYTEENTLYKKCKSYGVQRRCRRCHIDAETARNKTKKRSNSL